MSLAKSRFDWADALHEVAAHDPARHASSSRSLAPSRPAWASRGAPAGDPLRASLPVPAFELKGCTGSQADVARLIAAMRRIEGVQRVSLSSSEKTDQGGGGGGGGGAAGDCRGGSSQLPAFSMTIFFKAPAARHRHAPLRRPLGHDGPRGQPPARPSGPTGATG